MSNLAEYQTPEIYDAEYGSFKDDYNVFVGLKHRGSALDLACGTGRLTLALAKAGLSCVGLDASTCSPAKRGKKKRRRRKKTKGTIRIKIDRTIKNVYKNCMDSKNFSHSQTKKYIFCFL